MGFESMIFFNFFYLEYEFTEFMYAFILSKQEHSYMHSGVSDTHVCEFCAKPFRYSTQLSTHRRKMHPEEVQQLLNRPKI